MIRKSAKRFSGQIMRTTTACTRCRLVRIPPSGISPNASAVPRTSLPIPIPLDCTDRFSEAYYGRPEMLLDQPHGLSARRGVLLPTMWCGVSRTVSGNDLVSGRWGHAVRPVSASADLRRFAQADRQPHLSRQSRAGVDLHSEYRCLHLVRRGQEWQSRGQTGEGPQDVARERQIASPFEPSHRS